MNMQLVEIQPRELKFEFEVKKQSMCAVHLANITDQYVAFKVKTTSPKKYCVRPNIGIIKPKSTCDFTVIMQAQKSAPSEMQCKDKFLIQSTMVPFGTTEDGITSGMFSKDSHKYIEETKLRVVLATAPNSSANPPTDVVLNQEASFEISSPKEPHSPVLRPVNGVIKQDPSYETSVPKDKLNNGIENLPPTDMLMKKVEAVKNVKTMEHSRSLKVMDNIKSVSSENEEFYLHNNEESKHAKDVEDAKLKLTKDIEELQSKISFMNSKLAEAESTIQKLKEERSGTIHEKEILKQELAILRRRSCARKVQVGFPPLFVCMAALISLMIGLLFRA